MIISARDKSISWDLRKFDARIHNIMVFFNINQFRTLQGDKFLSNFFVFDQSSFLKKSLLRTSQEVTASIRIIVDIKRSKFGSF
jgi:hypothetical protein